MFRILFCASVQCSAVPLLDISILCFSVSTLIRACPFRCALLLSFLCLCYPLHSRTLLCRVNSSLFDSLPWRLSWNRSYAHLFRFRSGPSDSVSHVVIHILAIHFLHKAALCSSVSVSLHVRSNPYQINAFPYLFASTPVNSPPFQFIFTRIPSSPSVSISVLLHAIPYLTLLLTSLSFHCLTSHVRATPLLFKSFWIISLPLLVHSLHFHAIANHIQSVLFRLGAAPCHSISHLCPAVLCHCLSISAMLCYCVSNRCLSNPFHYSSTPLLCCTF